MDLIGQILLAIMGISGTGFFVGIMVINKTNEVLCLLCAGAIVLVLFVVFFGIAWISQKGRGMLA